MTTYTVASWQFETEDGSIPAATFRCKHKHKTIRAANFCLASYLNSPLQYSQANEAFHLAPWTHRGVVRSDGTIEIRARKLEAAA